MLTRPLVAICLALLVACSGGEPRDSVTRDVGFDEVFQLVQQVQLEETAPHVIVGVERLRRFPEGRFLIPDRKASTLRIHGDQGNLLARVGRFGQGPGEFQQPFDAAIAEDGSIFVAEGGAPRVTHLDSTFAYLNSFLVSADGVKSVESLGGDTVLVGHGGATEEGGVYAVTDAQGTVLGKVGKRKALMTSVPYWLSVGYEGAAVAGNRVYAMTSLLYPVEVFSLEGEHLFALGTPPPSWEQASQPERGEYAGVATYGRLQNWLTTFTTMDRIDAYRDSLIIVTHARFEPDVSSMWNREQYALDIYTTDGEKLYEDVPVPGRILRADQYLYALVAEPPEPWTIGVYELQDGVTGKP